MVKSCKPASLPLAYFHYEPSTLRPWLCSGFSSLLEASCLLLTTSCPIPGTMALLLCICCTLCPHEMLECFFDNYGFICTISSVKDIGQGCLFPWLPAHHRCMVSRQSFQLWDCVPVLPWSQFPHLWPGDALTCLRASPGPVDRGGLLLALSGPGEVGLFVLLRKLLRRMVSPQVCQQCFRFEVQSRVLSTGLLVGPTSPVHHPPPTQGERPGSELLAGDEQPFLLLWLSTLLLFWGLYCSLRVSFSFAVYFGTALFPKGRLCRGPGLVHIFVQVYVVTCHL